MSLQRPPGIQGRHRPTKSDRGNIRLYGRSERIRSPAQRGEVTRSGPIPPEIDWSDLRAYVCNSCKDHCINWIESDCARASECRSCYRVRAALLSTASEGEGEAARREASAPERPEGATASTGRKRTPSHGGPTRKPERTPRPRRGRGERENRRATGL